MARKITARKAAKYRRLILRAKSDYAEFRARKLVSSLSEYVSTYKVLYDDVILAPAPYFRTFMTLLSRDEEVYA